MSHHDAPPTDTRLTESVAAAAERDLVTWHSQPFVTSTTLHRAGLASYSTQDRAVASGLLPVYGRRGGGGVRIYRTADALAYLRGDTATTPSKRTPPPVRRSAPQGDALARIAATAAGGAR
jgi:hypothetical protein